MAIIWGGTWPLGRWLVSSDVGGETIPPLMIALIRYFVVIWFFFLILFLREKSLNFSFVKKHWKIFLVMGMSSVTIYQIGYMFGEFYTSASDASVIIGTLPMLVILFSSFLLKSEAFEIKKLIGAMFSFGGILIVAGFSPNINVPNRFLGDLLIFLGAVTYAFYTVISRQFLSKKREDFEPSSLFLITWVSFFGFLTLLPVSLALNPEYLQFSNYLSIPVRVWLGLFYLIFFSTIGGYWFYLEGVKRLSASKAAIFQNLVPIIGVALSAIFLGEIFNPFVHLSALSLIVAGIFLVHQSK